MSIELSFLTYTLFRLIHVAIFFSNASMVAALANGLHSRMIVKTYLLPVLATVCKSSKWRRRLFAQAEAEKVYAFLAEHNTTSAVIMLGNRQLWGRVMATFLLTNVPCNVHALSVIIFSNRKLKELTVLLIVLVIQSIAFAISVLPLAYTSRTLHEPQNRLVALQPYLIGPRWTRLKLKLDDLKCRLSCGPKVAVTIGPTKDLVSTTLVEVISTELFGFTESVFLLICVFYLS